MNIYSSPFLRRTFAVAAALALFFAQDVHAQTAADRIKLLETTLQDLLKRDEEKDRLLPSSSRSAATAYLTKPRGKGMPMRELTLAMRRREIAFSPKRLATRQCASTRSD